MKGRVKYVPKDPDNPLSPLVKVRVQESAVRRSAPSGVGIRKPTRVRSLDYMKWIHDQDCIACEVEWKADAINDWMMRPVEAAHVNDGHKGLGTKVSDFRCLPLCAEHHREGPNALDRVGNERFEAATGVKLEKEISSHIIRWLAEEHE